MTISKNLIHHAAALEKAARVLREAAAEIHTANRKRRSQRGPIRYDLREQIKARGLTYRTVAAAIGCNQKTLQNVLGGSTISRPLLERLETVLGIC
jgi:hypothetical protein